MFQWRKGQGDLWQLQDAELITPRSGLRSNLDRLALAAYGVELVELLAADAEDHQRIYELLCSYLDYLEGGGDFAVARLLFELRLVYLLGYIPHLLHCSDCLKIFANEPVRFDSRRGGCLCCNCAGVDDLEVGLGSIGTLARSLRISHQQFNGFKLGSTTIRDAHMLLSDVLRQLLPREPNSLKFLARLSARES